MSAQRPRLPTNTSHLGQRNSAAPKPEMRRTAISALVAPGGPKNQRTTKTSQKLVMLPSAPQTKPLDEDSEMLGYETDAGVREHKTDAERMSKDQRRRAGFKRLTAYCVAESFKMKLLSSFLKREHNVAPRVFDEALYAMYHLPLLPGYGPGSNFRSSVPAKGVEVTTRLSEAEENGYQGSYFPAEREPSQNDDGYITSSPTATRESPLKARVADTPSTVYDVEQEERPSVPTKLRPDEEIAEVIFFEYGVVVFFGLNESQERGILEDIDSSDIMYRKIPEEQWEVEECHYTHDPNISYPRIYNDFFTLKSRSHLLKLSISHALAQSTLLARYESTAQHVLTSPLTLSIPKQLATSGVLQLRRNEALKLTGRLFKLRRDVNLVSNVLDVPELFWSEASLKELYDAVREYMEIEGRVQGLNEKLVVVSSFLDAIHEHLNTSAMDRITWIVIWLIVAACLVELGEVVARLVFHASKLSTEAQLVPQLTRPELLQLLDNMST